MRYYQNFIHNGAKSAPCISFLLLIIGCSLFIYQTVYGVKAQTERRLNIGTALIDNILDNSYSALDKVELYLSESCDESLPIMKNLVDIVQGLQSFNIEDHNGVIVCSTSDKLLGYKFNLDSFEDSDLFIKKSDTLTPGHPLLILKRHVRGKILFLTIAGSNIYNSLDVVKNLDKFSIETEDFYLDNQGNLTENDGRYPITHASENHPFKLSTKITLDDYIAYGLKENLFLLIIFALLALSYACLSFIKTRSPSSVHQMKKALINNEFVPYVQPIMNAKGELAGLEVLIRWLKPHGMIYPDTFIPAAEQSGLIIPITEQLMGNVAKELNPIANQLPKDFHVGVNISAKHFDENHQQSLIKCCEEFKGTPTGKHSELLIEITERELITDYEQTNHAISALQVMGAKLAIDDFGTGHSTLDYIKNLSIDTIKIDKSFVDLIDTGAITAQLVDNIIDLSQRLNVSIIAEGVESELQVQYLSERGVDYLQGYYFAKPMPIQDFIDQYFKP
ncbi:EAL domain-containing protein [Vibrio sp. CK2-1]|uniref:EAL domain-containing protein n=1 Tax=Vibrio sp. CK2-1 TaxID=2912249 RepID=UPI001F3BBAED|nr:EAL domain-containing protein [Vibrio sp. CK2-1]MCF7353058.1 EAL domain-containing protein [Vibrio sp. CK2-1]